ncbi:MAG: Pyruvate kinase [candidate division WWE3 bacterium GW2011_GWF2_41_45]|uniref:Pyruvate kinase n=3 Tax=Katanobacteria TaxID=422282 RepID=A0A1F4W044_UNCKA|nr:MAG: Pyruvate kinase [candidate division WWE3 bacterium GW2011_GWC2_41_23]KKS10293.1 MAG: Pyruvate kinase [candidate division WWE3 bacterium GW2011_GWF2_41_45]KKS12260.1 MAG: Pyruvate kinase [candidate division WWE3 bacterium GW2011_GWF1_41_53]KKS20035.1 MAG: Pyruvate kinase [candidate division WWE3 bacterium GW2011_GWE1_41_72]KKS28446.1 MAG: Pyruvate kinase [candidate division WWE3 bacterium GW2011_GWC1_42_102]KKS30042.1 MAG: Pyruvate kinase [candidate division WWE3 bacterium GW2011_GWD2_4
MHSGKFTKIIATLGPSSSSEKVIKELITSGVNLFRFNTKHADTQWHLEHIKKVREVSGKLGINTGVIVDLQGPECVLITSSGEEITLKKDDLLKIKTDVLLNPPEVYDQLNSGDTVVVDDGKIEFEVSGTKGELSLKVVNAGLLKSGKGVSFKNKKISTPTIGEDEKKNIKEFLKSAPDFFALSFVRNHEDVINLSKFLSDNGSNAGIISKIETQGGIDDFDLIVEKSDGIMVARGDLGVEVSLEKITYYQKMIIEKCRAAAKPVIVATQMLESMTTNPSPTRAEVSDISNAVRDGADAVMLSGETAIGKYPIESVKFMHKIVSFNEKAFHVPDALEFSKDRTFSIVKAAVEIIRSDNGRSISKILVATETGKSARIFSSFRPEIPIIALTQNEDTLKKLGLSYGVLPNKIEFPEHGLVDVTEIAHELEKRGILSKGENIIVVHGKRWQDPGNTNSLYVFNVS